MKTAVLGGIALVCSSAAFAETPPAPADAPKAVTLTAPGTMKLPELRVVSVQPATGNCPERESVECRVLTVD